ncbi:hypothetical protein RhiirA5_381034 [Rhizophagus irregularis]|uniref:Uncharacterized protein n=1 Tax=Rhizophagus irregularis TaxID=588596 RepID=A0A2N0P6A3_9GLOM|nr:hypothetical protein RhiirA5_381034 [Rhizophagus irregularis]
MSQKHLNLDRLVPILKNEFSNELQGVRPTEIEFFNNNDRTTSLDCGMTLTNDNTSSKNPLVIRYPLSDSSMLGKRELDQTDFEFEIEKIPLIGIITTGGVWVFIRNTGQKIEISEEFECSYTGTFVMKFFFPWQK